MGNDTINAIVYKAPPPLPDPQDQELDEDEGPIEQCPECGSDDLHFQPAGDLWCCHACGNEWQD